MQVQCSYNLFNIKALSIKYSYDSTVTQSELTPDCMEALAWRVAENTALALQEFAKTGNIAYLLVIQRHLVAVQDENGDK